MIKKAKLMVLILVTFMLSLAIVSYALVQLWFLVPALKNPSEHAHISKQDLMLNFWGIRISEDQQMLFEQNEGTAFYSDSKVEDLVYWVFFILAPSVILTSSVVLIARSISRGSRERMLKRKELSLRNEYFQKYPLPATYYEAACSDRINYNPSIVQPSLYLWFENRSIHLISGDYHKDIGKIVIENDAIFCFFRYGDFFTSTDIYEKSASFEQTLIGALIGGGVGAILASRGPITSTTQVHDKRETVVMLRENDQERYLFFDPNVYNLLMHQIPNKEASRLSAMTQTAKGDDVVEKLAKLGELNAKGYISQEEFEHLKAKLLKSIS